MTIFNDPAVVRRQYRDSLPYSSEGVPGDVPRPFRVSGRSTTFVAAK